MGVPELTLKVPGADRFLMCRADKSMGSQHSLEAAAAHSRGTLPGTLSVSLRHSHRESAGTLIVSAPARSAQRVATFSVS